MALRGVLFDWRGTLVHDPPDEVWVTQALERVMRTPSTDVVANICERLRQAGQQPDVIEAQASQDCSVALHRNGSMLLFRAAGLDHDLAEALYAIDLEPANHPYYPEVGETLRALHERDSRIAVVSDIHFDLRPEFAAAGFGPFIDAYVLSFEHGVQKPDPKIFEIALDAIGLAAHEALMVGDRASRDGAATAVGIATLLLPPTSDLSSARGLNLVLDLINP